MSRNDSNAKLTLALTMLCALVGTLSGCSYFYTGNSPIQLDLGRVGTLAGRHREIGEPFGVALKDGNIYVSDGDRGKIVKIGTDGRVTDFAAGLSTPSAIAVANDGSILVADTGSNTIKSVGNDGSLTVVAGVENGRGYRDGPVGTALFNGPIGVTALPDGGIVVADTYNDRIRLIRGGAVTTLAGSAKGFADGPGTIARFNTPLGLAVLGANTVLVADSGNGRIRAVDLTGGVSTVAGSGELDIRDGTLATAALYRPTAIAVGPNGILVVTDGNAIRAIGLRSFPFVETISSNRRGLLDGDRAGARFNRPSGIAVTGDGKVIVADSENQLVRAFGGGAEPITKGEIAALRYAADEFRSAAPGRWPFDPPLAKREIAGTLGEIRGDLQAGSDKPVWFHNGLDIAGGYGETVRFVRTEKVLDPHAVENVGGPRELIRLPTMGYIHIRLGRDSGDQFFDGSLFQAVIDEASGKLTDLRVPRGTQFNAGDPIGTLNALNHVHLIAGRSGAEINAIAALDLPGVADRIPPVIEKVRLFDANWREIETGSAAKRIILNAPVRVAVQAYDRVDGNSQRRRLGLYRLGYQLFRNGTPISDPVWNISFDRMPANEAVKFVYAAGSRSGYTPDTVFDYIVTNRVNADGFEEGSLDASALENGAYTLRVFAADYFGNVTDDDIQFEVAK
jgi:hypothetical protein